MRYKMLELLENNSGKIGLILGCCTLLGGAVLLGLVPGAAVLLVTFGSHIFVAATTATAVGTVAAGGSYLRREYAHRTAQERDSNRSEQRERAELEEASDFVRENQRNAQTLDSNRQNITFGSIEMLQSQVQSLDARNNTTEARLRRIEHLFANLSRHQAREVLDEEMASYVTDEYSDTDSNAGEAAKEDEANVPLLSPHNLFSTTVRVPLEMAGHDSGLDTGPRQRLGVATK